MRAGRLDSKITIQSATLVRDAYGSAIETWTTFATVWASEKPIRGTEYFAASQINVKIDSIFTIRYLDGLLETMRIYHDGKYWDIRSINELGRQDGMEIYAEVKRT